MQLFAIYACNHMQIAKPQPSRPFVFKGSTVRPLRRQYQFFGIEQSGGYCLPSRHGGMPHDNTETGSG